MPAFATVDDMPCIIAPEHWTKRYDDRTVVEDLRLSTAARALFGRSRRVSCPSREGLAAGDDLVVVDQESARPRVRRRRSGRRPVPAGGVVLGCDVAAVGMVPGLDVHTGRSREA